MNKEVVLTPEGKIKLEDELAFLETTKRAEIGDRIRVAREFGDISENSEYDDAKNEQAWLEARISEVTQILSNATVVEPPKRIGKVSIGSRVLLADASGNERTYQVVGSAEADPANDKISNESPVGSAILGRKKGDVVSVTTPSGKKIEFTISKISR